MQDTLPPPTPMDAAITPVDAARTEQLSQPLSAERVNELSAIAKPLVDAIAATQEIRNGLANLWKEAHPLEEVTDTQEASVGAFVTSTAVVDAEADGIDATKPTDQVVNELHARAAVAKSRPKWLEIMPKDDADTEGHKKLNSVLEEFPEEDRPIVLEHLHELKALSEKVTTYSADQKMVEAHRLLGSEKYRVMYLAGQYGYCVRQSRELWSQVSDMRLRAHQRGRHLNSIEKRVLDRLQQQATLYDARGRAFITDEAVGKEVKRRENVARAEQLRSGFLETDRMSAIISVVVPRLAAGLPAGFFGEIGGAKSALGVHIAKEYFETDPVKVDCGPDVTMVSLFGGTKLRADGKGGTETYEESGSVTRAAEEGKPLILDEFDTLPGRIRTALNGALQWRPGQTVRPFGLDRDITVKPGFCIIVTANLRSSRYDREKLDISTLDRLQNGGAGIYEIGYPDADVVPGSGSAKENLLLALAQLTNEYGRVVFPSGLVKQGENIDPAERLIQFVNAVHLIQRLFSDATAVVGNEAVVPDSQHVTRSKSQGKPVLEEAVISPRGMLGMLRNLQISGDTSSLSNELAGWIAMQRSEMDRKIVSIILASRGLLFGQTEESLKIPKGTLASFMRGRTS
jgi:hypothetical protein